MVIVQVALPTKPENLPIQGSVMTRKVPRRCENFAEMLEKPVKGARGGLRNALIEYTYLSQRTSNSVDLSS